MKKYIIGVIAVIIVIASIFGIIYYKNNGLELRSSDIELSVLEEPIVNSDDTYIYAYIKLPDDFFSKYIIEDITNNGKQITNYEQSTYFKIDNLEYKKDSIISKVEVNIKIKSIKDNKTKILKLHASPKTAV